MTILQRRCERPGRGFSLRNYLLNLDWVLLLATGVLVAVGIAMSHSATHADANIGSATEYVGGQALRPAGG